MWVSFQNDTEFKVWTTGCADSVMDSAADKMPIIIPVVMAVALPQPTGIILGRVFDGQIQRQSSRYKDSLSNLESTCNFWFVHWTVFFVSLILYLKSNEIMDTVQVVLKRYINVYGEKWTLARKVFF